MPKESSQCICLSVTLIDSVFRTGEILSSSVFRRMEYIFKEKRLPKYITDDTEISSDEKILIKKITTKKVLTKKIVLNSVENVFLRKQF